MLRHGLLLRFKSSCATVQQLSTQLGNKDAKRWSSTGGYHSRWPCSGKICFVCFGSFPVSSKAVFFDLPQAGAVLLKVLVMLLCRQMEIQPCTETFGHATAFGVIGRE